MECAYADLNFFVLNIEIKFIVESLLWRQESSIDTLKAQFAERLRDSLFKNYIQYKCNKR